jgi:hypothetical protein
MGNARRGAFGWASIPVFVLRGPSGRGTRVVAIGDVAAPLCSSGAVSVASISGRFRKTATRSPCVHQPDSDAIHRAVSCIRLFSGHPAQTLTFCISRGRPPITQRPSPPYDAYRAGEFLVRC